MARFNIIGSLKQTSDSTLNIYILYIYIVNTHTNYAHQSIGTPLVVAVHKISSFHCFVHPSWSLFYHPSMLLKSEFLGLDLFCWRSQFLLTRPSFLANEWHTSRPFPLRRPGQSSAGPSFGPTRRLAANTSKLQGLPPTHQKCGGVEPTKQIGAWHQRIFRCYMVLHCFTRDTWGFYDQPKARCFISRNDCFSTSQDGGSNTRNGGGKSQEMGLWLAEMGCQLGGGTSKMGYQWATIDWPFLDLNAWITLRMHKWIVSQKTNLIPVGDKVIANRQSMKLQHFVVPIQNLTPSSFSFNH